MSASEPTRIDTPFHLTMDRNGGFEPSEPIPPEKTRPDHDVIVVPRGVAAYYGGGSTYDDVVGGPFLLGGNGPALWTYRVSEPTAPKAT